MNHVSGMWHRLPVLVRAVLTGLLVVFFGASVWSVLIFASHKLTAPIPWAGGPHCRLVFGPGH
jgi:hypothetical protein